MTDEALENVTLDVLRQDEHGLLALNLDRQQRVLGTQREEGGVALKGHMDRVVVMAIHDGGNLVVTTDATSSALTELGTLFGLEVNDVCHGSFSFSLT